MANKLAVVTGSSAGIGKAVAEALLAGGWQVVGIARRPSDIGHPDYHHVRLDLADGAVVERYFESGFPATFPLQGLSRVGLVNNAALIEPIVLSHRLPMVDLERAFRVNTVVPMWMTAFFLRHAEGIPLRIVNVSSGAAHMPRSGWAAYCSSKAALLMAGRVFGEEMANGGGALAGRDAGVLNYMPGIVDTGMQTRIRNSSPEDFPGVERFVEFFESGRLNPPDGPAAEIRAYLESDPPVPFQEGRLGE